MQHNKTLKNRLFRGAIILGLFAGGLVAINACRKNTTAPVTKSNTAENSAASQLAAPFIQNQPQTFVLTVAAIRNQSTGNEEVLFNQNEEIFNVTDAATITLLQKALAAGNPVKVTVDPWKALITQAALATNDEVLSLTSRPAAQVGFPPVKINLATMSADAIDNVDNNNMMQALMPINNTTSTLTSMVPDLSTAQLMFDYITKQCCALGGPYAIDYCISFQYCEDGCYARAHKMCWIINNKFNYATQKVFSFANAGTDELCVKGEKWGGCCVNWWYHVAPLVTIKTPTGPKAYVFDPAMFDQPVLLSAWLHAQENPACVPGGDSPHVTMINVQPTASYSPASYTGYSFDTDPTYSSTDTTLVHYSTLATCP